VFSKLKSLLYNQVYINIIAGNKKTTIYVEEVNFNGSTQNTEEVFDTSQKKKINSFIIQNTKKSPIHYISLLDNSLSQGATPTCASSDMAQFCDMGVANHICYTPQWGYYTSKLDILELRTRYKVTGLDYIFSPFLVLVNFFKDKIDGELSLYILVGIDSITLSVYEKSVLLFAESIDMQTQNEFQDELGIVENHDDEEDLELDDSSINLDDIATEDVMDDLDDFDDIEDLDTFDEMDEFSEDDSEEIGETIIPDLMSDESSFGEDYHRFSLIQSAIKMFYNDDRFTSDFISQVYIADSIGMCVELKKFLEEEMFLDVFVRKIDLPVELCELAKVEKR